MERLLALAAAALGLVIARVIWVGVSSQQEMWPLHVGAALIGGAAQVALMLLVIR